MDEVSHVRGVHRVDVAPGIIDAIVTRNVRVELRRSTSDHTGNSSSDFARAGGRVWCRRPDAQVRNASLADGSHRVPTGFDVRHGVSVARGQNLKRVNPPGSVPRVTVTECGLMR
jgi:hypothetical protein